MVDWVMGQDGGDSSGMSGAADAAAAPRRAPRERVRLRILATSDVHAHLMAWDYHADRAEPGYGLGRIATLIARMRRGADVCLLVDNGDFLQGSPLGDAAALGIGLGPGGLHPVIAAMNALGYDAAALGNHEFSHGIGLLMKVLRQADFPVLSANILTFRGATPLEDQTLFPARRLLRREVRGQMLTIGLVGLTPPQTLTWEASHIDRPLQARAIVETAAAHAGALRDEGADIVVALCHAGIGLGGDPSLGDNEAGLVAGLPGIDAVVAGHSHRRFPDPGLAPDLAPDAGLDPLRGRIHGRPVVAPGFNGSHLGVIDLVLAPKGKGWPKGWKITTRRARLLPVARRSETGRMQPLVAEDAGLHALALPAHEATRTWAARVIGANPRAASSHFALVMPSETVRLIAQGKIEAVRAALAGGPLARLPLLSAAAPIRAGGRGGPQNYTVLPRGPLTLRHLVDLYPFPNTLVALHLTGAEVAAWLERSASLYRQIPTGAQDAELIDPAFPAFNFDSIEGLTWRFDLAQPARFNALGRALDPAASRVRDLCWRGQPLAPDQPVILATNSYRQSGAGGFAAGLERRVVYRSTQASRDILERHITALGVLPPPQPPNWGFVPQAGTSVLFASAPDAVPPPGSGIEPLDLRPDGFRGFRLSLDQAMTRGS
jgi:2',3'-cyclic-nucleotide 2'-phosphodiesterase/3'-nucleotidase